MANLDIDEIPGVFRKPNPLTPDQATRTAYAAYATALLGPSPFHTSFYDGALEVAEPYVVKGIKVPNRWATYPELVAVIELAEKRDDEQYRSIQTTNASRHYTLTSDPSKNWASLNFLAVIVAEAAKQPPSKIDIAEAASSNGRVDKYVNLQLTERLAVAISKLRHGRSDTESAELIYMMLAQQAHGG